MFKKIPQFLIPILFIFAVGLYGQDCFDNNNDGVVDTADYPIADPGPDGGCGDYADCNDNGAYDLGEPCFEGDHPGGGGGDPASFAGDEQGCWDNGFVYCYDMNDCFPAGHLCGDDHPGSGGEGDDDFGMFDINSDSCLNYDEVLAVFQMEPEYDGDEDAVEAEFNVVDQDGDGCLDYDEFHQADDGDGDNEEYGEHTVGNCIAFAEGRGSYWIGNDEFAVWDDPNVDCNYLFDQIGYQPPAYMCSWTWDDGNTCGYTSDDPDDNHEHCGYTWPDGNACGHTSDDPSAYHGHCDHLWGDGNPCGASFDDEGAHQAHSHCGFTGSDGITCGHTSDDPSAFHDHCGYTFSDGNTCDASFDNQGDFDAHQHCGFTFSDGNICGWAPWENNTFHEHCDQVFPDGNPCGASFDNEGDMDAHQDDHADDGGGWYCQICDEHFATEADMDQHAADMGHTDEGCDPDGDYPTDPPGAGNGCIDYADCNGNNVYDLSEPCYDND